MYFHYIFYCLSDNIWEIFILTFIVALLFLCLFLWCNHALLYSNESFNKLHEAVFENNVIEAIRLVQKCSDAINRLHPLDGYSAFMVAYLQGADVNLRSSQGETPFYLAIFHHIQHPNDMDATCIRALYYAGSDVNATNAKGYAPIHLAANFGHTNLVKWLLSKGASANVQPYPYIMAHMQGHQLTASLLKNLQLRAIESTN